MVKPTFKVDVDCWMCGYWLSLKALLVFVFIGEDTHGVIYNNGTCSYQPWCLTQESSLKKVAWSTFKEHDSDSLIYMEANVLKRTILLSIRYFHKLYLYFMHPFWYSKFLWIPSDAFASYVNVLVTYLLHIYSYIL